MPLTMLTALSFHVVMYLAVVMNKRQLPGITFSFLPNLLHLCKKYIFITNNILHVLIYITHNTIVAIIALKGVPNIID